MEETRKFTCECGKIGGIELKRKESKTGVEMKVFRCTGCKKQYGLKGLLKLEELD